MAVRVVTDSACDLLPETCEQLGIEVVPLTIRFGDREYVDRKELSSDEFWRELEIGRRCCPRPRRRRSARSKRRSAASTTKAPTASSASTSPRTCRRPCSPRRSRRRRSTGSARSRSSTPRTASMGIGILALHAARRAPKAPTSRRSRARSTTAAIARRSTRRSTRSSTCARAAASAARRRCSARCSRSSRSSPSIDGAVEQAGKVRTRSKALRFMIDRIPEGSVESVCVMHSGAPDIDEFLDARAAEGARRRDRRRAHRPGGRRARRSRAPSAWPGSSAS